MLDTLHALSEILGNKRSGEFPAPSHSLLRPHVFECGLRGKNIAQEGSGTDLAVATDIANAIGGKVRIEDQHEHGATFVIQLPAAPLNEEAATVS